MARPPWKEWPLVVFTLLSQTAAGAFWIVAGTSFWTEKARGWNSRYLTYPFLAAVVVALGLAAAISLFHLGRPWRAVFVLSNLKRSWLSREILFELVFVALAASLAALVWKKAYRPLLIQVLVALAFAVSIMFIISMSKIYMMRTVPAWRSLYTPLSFFGSALLLGPLAAAASSNALLDLGRKAYIFLDAAAMVTLAAVLLIILTIVLTTPGLGFLVPKKATLLEIPASKVYPYLVLKLLFLAGTVLCFFLYYKNPRIPVFALAFFSACGAEVSGRLLYYAVYSRLGV